MSGIYRAPSRRAKFLRAFGCPLPPDHRGCVVYFLRAANGLVKIGFATDFYARMKSLDGGSPVALSVDAWIYGDFALEMALHNRFRLTRVRGEWFVPSAEYDALVKEVRARLGDQDFAKEFDARFVPIPRSVMDGGRKKWALALGTKKRGSKDRDAFNAKHQRSA